MVPKPENEGVAAYNSADEQEVPIMGVVQKVPSIYSASEGEDCAKLVKNGQLDNFTPTRTLRRQELAQLVNESDCEYRGRSVTRSTLRRSKSEHRSIQEDVSFNSRRSARSSSRDQIKVGDRVIIKNKYLGTCRYVGPIEEENFQLPEVWYGVELDEKLTQNSGIFGSREYFACAFGHGLMVMGAKIKKVRTPNVSFKNGPCTTTLRPSKSMSNLASSRTRVSQGADSWVMSRKKFANQHPMATLNRIKQIQQASPGQVIFDETPRDPYGALLHTFQTGADGGYAHDNLLRRSFERIVPQEINNQLDYGLYRNRSLPPMHGQSPEAMMAQFSTLQRSTSAPQYDFNRRRPSFMSTGSGSISLGSNPGDIFYRPANGGQLCDTCLQCKTCMPVSYRQQQMTPMQKSSTQNHSQSFTLPKQFINRNQSFDYGHEMFQPGRKVAFNSSTGSSASSTSSSGVSSSASSTTGSTSSLDEIAPMTEPLSVEYERWKSTYGLNRGRSMKKGLAKLSMALQA